MADTTRTIRIKIDSKNAVKSVDQLDNKMSGLGTTVNRVAAAVAAAFATNSLVKYTDEFTNLQNQLRLVTKGTENLATVTNALFESAQRSRSGFASTGELYSKLARSTTELDLSQRDLVRITETVNKSFAVSGASAQEADNAVRQLAQGLSAGALRGDEFNSVAEQAPGILRAVAAETGKSIGELREFAAEGGITTELLVSALQNYASVVDGEFAQSQVTIEQASTTVRNSFVRLIGTLDQATGVSGTTATAIASIADAMTYVEEVVASGAISNVFNAQLAFVQEDIDKTTTFIADEFNNLFPQIGNSTETLTSFIGDSFLNIVPNVKAMVQIIAVEIATLVEKTSANMSALKDALNVFDDVSAEQAFETMKERFAVLDELRTQEISRILEKNELDKAVNIATIENSAADVEAFRQNRAQKLEIDNEFNALKSEQDSVVTQKEAENDKLSEEQLKRNRLAEIAILQRSGNSIVSSIGAIGKKSLKIQKAVGLAQAGVSIATGIARAQELGFPANIAEAARVAAVGVSAVQSIKGAKVGSATPVSVGSSSLSGASASIPTSTASAAPVAPVAQTSDQVQTLDTGALINELRNLGSEPIPASFAARILEAIPEARQITGEG